MDNKYCEIEQVYIFVYIYISLNIYVWCILSIFHYMLKHMINIVIWALLHPSWGLTGFINSCFSLQNKTKNELQFKQQRRKCPAVKALFPSDYIKGLSWTTWCSEQHPPVCDHDWVELTNTHALAQCVRISREKKEKESVKKLLECMRWLVWQAFGHTHAGACSYTLTLRKFRSDQSCLLHPTS